MSYPAIQSGTMMIREGFLLPDSAHLDTRSYSDTWRTVLEFDSFDFDRKLRAAGWYLFFMAGECKITALGWGAAATRRGVRRLLNSGRKSHVNCMEITQAASSRFLGFPYVAIRASFFHIQNDAVLHSSAERTLEDRYSEWACG
jgi:hypothetical protein